MRVVYEICERMKAMAVTSLDNIFTAKSIAVIGASDQEGSADARLVSNLLSSGFEGNEKRS